MYTDHPVHNVSFLETYETEFIRWANLREDNGGMELIMTHMRTSFITTDLLDPIDTDDLGVHPADLQEWEATRAAMENEKELEPIVVPEMEQAPANSTPSQQIAFYRNLAQQKHTEVHSPGKKRKASMDGN